MKSIEQMKQLESNVKVCVKHCMNIGKSSKLRVHYKYRIMAEMSGVL